MSDMLVKLYDIKIKTFENSDVLIKRAHPSDLSRIKSFVKDNFNESWANECSYALHNSPVSCYIAVRNKNIVGFACYDATAKGFFGPFGVLDSERGQKIGSMLFHKCLNSMKESGYAYAIIGWVSDAKSFYIKEANAIPIEDSNPSKSIYKNRIDS